ncbi:MAG: 3'-5' exonuclease [Roseiarcus sp.]
MMKLEQVAEALAGLLDATGRYRCLHRLDLDGVPSIDQTSFEDQIVAVVDVETTGLNPTTDRIIELAARLVAVAPHGQIVGIGPSASWLEDPGFALPLETTRLTGLTDADVAGQSIPDDLATAVFEQGSLIVSHNAAFDRPFLENRLEIAARRPWACSLTEVDWRRHHFDGRALSHLLYQCGLFSGSASHRAAADIDMLIGLLGHILPGGRTVASELIENSRRTTYRIDALGANYELKDALKSRGYRWRAVERVWGREVGEADRNAELDWLAANVYSPDARPRSAAPIITEVTAATRHRS